MDKPKLLIIDDDVAICESLIDILELEDYLVDSSHNAEDGIKKIEESFCNIVLLDMKLPDSDGIAVLEKIKEISPDTEVIIFTAYAEMDIVIKAMDRNAFSFLPKPYEIPYLITTIKRAREKQRITFENRILYQQTVEEEREWEDTFDAISDMISIHDKGFNIIRCNKAVIKKLNVEYRDIIGKKCYEAFHGRNEPWSTCPFVRCKESLKPESEEGEWMGGIFSMSCFPRFDEAGKFNGVVHIARDITERKKAEKALEQHIQELTALNRLSQQVSSSLSLDQVVQAALAGIIAAVNPDLALFFLRDGDNLNLQGIAPVNSKYSHDKTPVHRVGECLCGLAVSEGKPIYSNDILNDPRCTWEECKKTGLRSFAALPLFSGDKIIGVLSVAFGTQHEFEKQSEFLQILSNSISTGLQNVLLHIQEQHHAEELEAKVEERTTELTEANTRLKELDRLKSMFIASMSHELRTPLNSIIGFTGIILQGMDGEINPQQKDHLGRVNRSAKHLLTLINDIIDLSKVEAGKVDVFPEDIVLDEVINEAVDSVRLQANERGLALDVSVPHGVRMNTDRKRLYQCILNYLSNAVKFTESGTISVTAHDINGEVEILVSDTGIGISRQDQQRLFKPFVRIDSHLRAKTLGTGLGLYLTRKLTTELLGGTVGVQSRPGTGSTFTLRLPKVIKKD